MTRKTAKKVAKKPTRKTAKKVAKKTTKKTTKKKATKKVAKKAAKKTTKKTTKKTAKVAKKVAKKVVKKTPQNETLEILKELVPVVHNIERMLTKFEIQNSVVEAADTHEGEHEVSGEPLKDGYDLAPNSTDLTSEMIEEDSEEDAGSWLNEDFTTPEKEEKPSYTKEQVTQSLQEVSAKAGILKVKEIIESTGAQNVSSIPEEKYPQVMESCHEILSC